MTILQANCKSSKIEKERLTMTERVRVDIVCPCGRLLDYTRVSVYDGKTQGGARRGTKTCPACKKTVEYSIIGTNAYTNYR